jgi:hypothetical protein
MPWDPTIGTGRSRRCTRRTIVNTAVPPASRYFFLRSPQAAMMPIAAVAS